MGPGVYLTWDEPTAQWFADFSASKYGGEPIVKTYRIAPNLNFIYRESDEYTEYVAKLFYHDPSVKYPTGKPPRPDYIDFSEQSEIPFGDPIFAKCLAARVKEAGYDGVVGRKAVEGLVVFDSRNVIGYFDPLACDKCGVRKESCPKCKIPRCWECSERGCPCWYCKKCDSELEECYDESHPRWCPKCQNDWCPHPDCS
jgi:hypothetical protein